MFIMEQNICCQDMDNIDYVSLYCFLQDDNKICMLIGFFVMLKKEGKIIIISIFCVGVRI